MHKWTAIEWHVGGMVALAAPPKWRGRKKKRYATPSSYLRSDFLYFEFVSSCLGCASCDLRGRLIVLRWGEITRSSGGEMRVGLLGRDVRLWSHGTIIDACSYVRRVNKCVSRVGPQRRHSGKRRSRRVLVRGGFNLS